MLFNSIEFFLFLPTIFVIYWFVFHKSNKGQNYLLLIASYFFYGWWSWKFLGLLFIITLLDYAYGFGVASANNNKRKFFLWLSIINNLGVLCVFKYYNFFIVQFNEAANVLGIHFEPTLLNIALPIGISFYTFHGMSYIFDIYRKQQQPIKNFINYAVFVSFFPLLVAGPIERANYLLPQIQKHRLFNYRQAVQGCKLIIWGLFKKVFVADSLAAIVDPIFNNFNEFDSLTLIIGAIAFSFQIYGDFSGYSDVAIGTAKLFGFELKSNFSFPYFSKNLKEFWRKWHISLTSWFRDYLYIPLGGSKNSRFITIRNTFMIFIISGFWHGANWNFIFWGVLHAFAFLPTMINNHELKQPTNIPFTKNLKEIIQILFTFSFITFAWIFFRAADIESALGYLKHILINQNSMQIDILNSYIKPFYFITPLIIGDWYIREDERELKDIENKILRIVIHVSIALSIIYSFFLNQNGQFIYFQF